ncbi:MAG: hypothetical protein ACRYGB_02655 [Janthinobacterium lividum]
MNNFKKAALSLAFLTAGFAAQAQKSITEGVIVYSVTTNGQQNEAKNYFKGDSSAYQLQQGPADIKIISDDKAEYRAILVDVPVASIKKAAILTPADMEQMKSMEPTFTSTPTTETQTIAGFKCKKVTAKDSKSGKTYDVWVTNDVTTPTNSLTKYYSNFGGMPVKFSISQMGQQVDVLLKSITAEKVKPGTFAVPTDFEKITMQELMSMRGGN